MVLKKFSDKRFNWLKDSRFRKFPKKQKHNDLDKRFQGFEKVLTLRDPKTGKRCLDITKANETNQFLQPMKQETVTFKKTSLSCDEETPSSQSKKKSENINWLVKTESTCSSSEGISSTFDSSSEKETFDSDAENSSKSLTSVWDTFQEVIPTGEVTHRLALIGCDWDNVTSKDLFSLFMSVLCQQNSSVNALSRVAIYTSDFGWSKLQNGEIFEGSKNRSEFAATTEEFNDNEDSSFAVEAFRRYQRERSRYYYAVIECKNTEAASYLYDELNGVDCDFALDSLDLRFIPNDMPEFTQTFPRQCVSETTTLPKKVTAVFTDLSKSHQVLRHSKAVCAWDENPARRTKMLKRTFTETELEELDLKDYLASDVSNSENDQDCDITINDIQLPPNCASSTNILNEEFSENNKSIQNYQLQLLTKNASTPLAQSFHVTAPIEGEKGSFSTYETTFSSCELGTLAKKVKNHEDNSETQNLTPWECFLKKRKKKRLQRKMELKQRQNIMEPHYLSEKKKTKKKKKTLIIEPNGRGTATAERTNQSRDTSSTDPSNDFFNQVANDKRFNSLFTDSSMAIDVTNSKFKETDALKSFIIKTIELKKGNKKIQKND